MEQALQEKLEQAVWVAHTLFQLGRTSGSSANLSFLHQGEIFITASGSCFGRLRAEEFAVIDMQGTSRNGKKPSKEWPLHRDYYGKDDAIQCVIHTHGALRVLWSCRKFDRDTDIIPATPPIWR